MAKTNELEISRLTVAEIDDQAVGEILRLLTRFAGWEQEVSAGQLLQLAVTAPLIVARRPCGLVPEIVGVAGRVRRAGGGFIEVVAADPALMDGAAARSLTARLRAEPHTLSLFRPRAPRPFGHLAAAGS